MAKETTSTNQGIGDEGYKGSDLSEIEKIDRRETSVKGAENLTNQAVIIAGCKGASDAADVLNTFDNLIHVFCASSKQLMGIEGIGFGETYQIKATFEFTERIAAYCEEEHPKIVCKDVTNLLAPHMVLPQEEFRVILLDSKQNLIRFHIVSLGSSDTALVEPRDVFPPAITAGASVVIAHSHQSGDFNSSEQDVLLTRELCMCGLMGFEVSDHIIRIRDHVMFKESRRM